MTKWLVFVCPHANVAYCLCIYIDGIVDVRWTCSQWTTGAEEQNQGLLSE